MGDNKSAALIFFDVKAENGSNVGVFSDDELAGIQIITAAILILAFPANILVMTGYLNTSTALKKPANHLLVNLTISETILTSLIIPLQLLVNFIEPSLGRNNGSLCMAVGILTYPFYLAVIISMIFISVDRYYAVRAPLSYKFKVSKHRIGYMISYTWIHALGFTFGFGFALGIGYNSQMGVCGILWDNNMAASSVGAFTHIVLPFFLLLGLNINLVLSLRRQNLTAVNTLDQRQNQIWKTRQGKIED
jgi:hypothetical protein